MGRPFRFIHCGDLHLGVPFKNVSSLGRLGDEAMVDSTYTAFSNIVNYALEEQVDAVLICGDIYNSADHNLAAQVRFVRELERLVGRNISVFIVHGNHDPLDAWDAKVPLPEGVHVFSGKEVEAVPLIVRGHEVATVYGMSHSTVGIYENLSLKFKPKAEDQYAIGLLHASVGGQEGHDPYAPCSLSDLQACDIDYWALGHIHKRQVLGENPHIVYAGNPQGLHRNEKGAKGFYLVQVGLSSHTEVTFVESDALRFEEETISINSLKTVADIIEMIRHKKEMLRSKYRRPILVGLTLVGSGPLAEACQSESVRELWLKEAQGEEKNKSNFVIPYALENNTTFPLDLKERRKLPDLLGDYLAAYDKVSNLEEKEKLEVLRAYVEGRAETKRLGPYARFITDELLQKALDRAEEEGAVRLAGGQHEDI